MPGIDADTPILVVDDSVAIRARVEQHLERLGYRNVRTASSVQEGLDAFREQSSEVVFLDLVIGEERGPDFAAQALSERPFANILIMTALPGSHEFVRTAIAEGAADVISKPVTRGAIEQALDRLDRTLREEKEEPPKEPESPSYYG